MEVSKNLQDAYSDQYNEDIKSWRELGAKLKAENIIKLSKNITFKNVVEVGCGSGDILQYLSSKDFCSEMYALEISKSGLKQVQEKNIAQLKEALLFDGYKIPYPDNYFDLAICSHVLEHVEHERYFLRELKRISKFQIIEVPIDFSFFVDKKVNHFLSYGHVNIYTPALLRFLLKTEGFTPLAEIFYLYPNSILKDVYKGNKGYLKVIVKNLIFKAIPVLKKIKPQAYTILTSKTDKEIDIF